MGACLASPEPATKGRKLTAGSNRLLNGHLPDLAELRASFAPDPAPEVVVTLTPLADYDSLLTGAVA